MRAILLPPAGDGRRRSPGSAGFLLTETLATFTISAFVLLGLVSAASVLLRAVDGSVARVERIDDLGRAMEAIRRDVAGLSRARWNGAEPQAFVFRGGPNSLVFAQASTTPDGSRTHVAVALREIVVDGRPVLARSTARLGTRAASFGDLVFGPQREVWTGSARLRFAYLPQREGGGEPLARHSWPTDVKLPAAILVEAVDRETKRVLVTTRVTIEANADIGCLGVDDANPTPGAQADPSTQGAGGLPTDLPKPEVLPSPTAAPGAPGQATAAFCSRTEEPGDKAGKPGPVVAGASP